MKENSQKLMKVVGGMYVDNQTETAPSLHACTSSRTCYLLLAEWRMDASRDSIHLPWFRISTRQKRALRARMPAVDRQGGGRLSFEGDILADGGSWHTWESSKSIFSTMTTFHVAVNG